MDYLVHSHVLLGHDQRAQLRSLAAESGRSMGVLVREAVAQYLRAEVGPTFAQRRYDARYIVGTLPAEGASPSAGSPNGTAAGRTAGEPMRPRWWAEAPDD